VLPHTQSSQFQVSAYRKKKALTKKDRSLLDEIAEEMKNDVHRQDEEK
jgi:ribosomal protein S19E (S16A)